MVVQNGDPGTSLEVIPFVSVFSKSKPLQPLIGGLLQIFQFLFCKIAELVTIFLIFKILF